MNRFNQIMQATAVEQAAIEGAEQRAAEAEEARVVAELEAQMLRAELAELKRLHAAARRALGDALEHINTLSVDTEVLRYLLPDTGTIRKAV